EHLGRVCPLYLGLGYLRSRRPDRRELCSANGAEVPIRIERGPFAEMLRLGERLPHRRRGLREVADENERPLLSIFSYFSARSGTRRVLLTAAHFFFLPFTEDTCAVFSN